MKSGKFWFNTIALSTSVAVLLALAIAAVTGTAMLAFGQKDGSAQPAAAKPEVVTGVLTDAHCGARHPSTSGLNAGDCARICVKRGASWALVDGDSVYALAGDNPYFDKLAGQRVRVSGTEQGNTIQVQSIEAATP